MPIRNRIISNLSKNILNGINNAKNSKKDKVVMRRSVETREKMKIKILMPKIIEISIKRIFNSNIH
jgi:hypothetical protein